ncbi:unnamed protein product [Sphagnum balticum]
MEMDISEPKSRSFNIFLRFFQLGIALSIAILISKFNQTGCQTPFYGLSSVLSYVLVAINLLVMIYLRCREAFSKVAFFLVFIIDIILADQGDRKRAGIFLDCGLSDDWLRGFRDEKGLADCTFIMGGGREESSESEPIVLQVLEEYLLERSRSGEVLSGFRLDYECQFEIKRKASGVRLSLFRVPLGWDSLKLFSVYETDNSTYVILELLPLSLYGYLQKCGFPTQEQAKGILVNLLDGIAYLHDKGIMHRDLKL